MYKLRIISENNKFIFNELRAIFHAQDQHLTTTRSGASRAHSKAVAIKMVEELTAAAVDIRAGYVTRNGAPSAGAFSFAGKSVNLLR